eukprot:4430054-Pleurochrysis_carterae.AAC.1
MVRKVYQYAPRGFKQFCRWATDGAAEHSHGESNIRPRLSGAIEECSHERLIRRQEVERYSARWFARESVLYHFG